MKPTTNIAVRAARQAGKLLLRYYGQVDAKSVSEKGRNDFVSEVDRAAETTIIDVIRKAHSFPQFSVSIALRHRGQLESAVVYDPMREEMYTADRGGGAFLNDRRVRVTQRKDLHGALLGTGIPFRDQRFVDLYLAMMKTLIRDTAGIRRPGSAALDFAYLAAGRIDGFWELGLAPWDFAAGVLLVREAGGCVTDLAGGERFFETGNVLAGGLKVHQAMLREIEPLLTNALPA